MKSKKLLILVLILSFILPSTVFAYTTYGYKLIGGVYNRKYTVPSNANYTYNGTTINYGTLMRQAVANWNAAVDPGCCWWSEKTDVYFTETTDYSQSQFDFYISNFGTTGWVGWTEMYTSGGTSINPNHQAPNQDWAYAIIRFNVANFHSVSEPEKRGVIAHEMGHGMGLGHSNDSNAVMYDDWPQPEKPNSDDESGVRSIY